MTKNDNDTTNTVTRDFDPFDVAVAFSLLSRLKMPEAWVDPKRLAHSSWAFPLVGAVLGAFSGLAVNLCLIMGVSQNLSVLVGLAFLVLLTGGLHEDGLADCADGFGGGRSKEAALKIMKDSRLGTYGVLALIVFFLLRWTALTEVPQQFLLVCFIGISAMSRLPMVWIMGQIRPAKTDGFSQTVGRPNLRHALVATLFSVGISIFAFGWATLPIILVAAILLTGFLVISYKKIGGQTGDVLGATQQITEISALLALTAL